MPGYPVDSEWNLYILLSDSYTRQPLLVYGTGQLHLHTSDMALMSHTMYILPDASHQAFACFLDCCDLSMCQWILVCIPSVITACNNLIFMNDHATNRGFSQIIRFLPVLRPHAYIFHPLSSSFCFLSVIV